jgi:SNF2 family DNA or RNA helicase
LDSEPRWRHQQEAFEFVLKRWRRGQHGVMLAIVMGGGKGRVAVDCAVEVNAHSVLILCPLRVVDVWRAQFERFAPDQYHFVALDDRFSSVTAKMLVARGAISWGQAHNKPVAMAINYESGRTDPFANWAMGRPWDLIVCDESHRLKNATSRISKYCAHLGLHAHRRLALTGTPMAHQPTDIWAQFRFLDPYFLDPTFSTFRDRYAIMGGYFNKEIVGWRDLDKLEAQFRQLAYRVDESVLDLPSELDQTLTCELGEKAAEIYHSMETEMIAWLEEDREVTAANALVKLLRLAQITGGSVPDDKGNLWQIDRSKQHLLTDLLEDLDEPVVVFARFRSDLAAIHAAAAAARCTSFELSGSRDDLHAWRTAKIKAPVLAVQMQAGGVGIDLTRSRIAVYYSIGFSLAEYLQSRARVRRPPQTRPCVFYHIQARGSIDEDILSAVEARSDLIDSVLKELKRKGTRAPVNA